MSSASQLVLRWSLISKSFRYNSLPHLEEQPEISNAALKALCELFVHNGVQDVFGTRPDFFQEFASFLHHNNLADLVALQLLDSPQNSTRMELLIGPQATLMVDEKDLIGFEPPRITTGWSLSFQVGDDGIISCKGNDVYAEKKNTHQVFTDSKPLPTVESTPPRAIIVAHH